MLFWCLSVDRHWNHLIRSSTNGGGDTDLVFINHVRLVGTNCSIQHCLSSG